MEKIVPEAANGVNTADKKSSATACTFSQKWGDDPFTLLGHTQVPNALIEYGARIGLAPDECWLVTCILSYKFTAANPYPGQDALAAKYGRSVDTVQRVTNSIRAKGLLEANRERNDFGHFSHITYDFTPLRAALNECYYQDHPQTRPKYSAPVPMPQGCGMADGKSPNKSHTARLRHGKSAARPCRKNAVDHTAKSGSTIPQGCGTNKSPEKENQEENKQTEQPPQAGADSQAEEVFVVVDSFNSLVCEEEQDEEAPVVEDAPAPVVEDAPKAAEVAPVPVPVLTPVPAPLVAPVPAVEAETDRAVRRAAAELAEVAALRQSVLADYVSKWRADGLGDVDIAQVLAATTAVVVAKQPPPEDPCAFAVSVMKNKVKARLENPQAAPAAALEALPAVADADIDDLRKRYEALSDEERKEVTRRASLLVREAAGTVQAYNALPQAQYRALMTRARSSVMADWDRINPSRLVSDEDTKAGMASMQQATEWLREREKCSETVKEAEHGPRLANTQEAHHDKQRSEHGT